jgi:spore photoproduct lyase
MTRYCPDRVVVEIESQQDKMTSEILERLPGVPVGSVRSAAETVGDLSRCSDSRTKGKRTLILARNPSRFLKPCPGAGAEVCCNYYVLNFALNCHFECTYCILQSYLDNPALVIFTNCEDLITDVADQLGRAPERFFRIGTGELADSLALDDITHYSRRLVPFFAGLRNGILELKTKSDQIANLQGLDHNGRTVVSWSVNARAICQTEELKTSTLEERLSSARQCQDWGYRVGFHFDPLICYEGWEEGYRSAVEEIFRAVDPAGVAWVSLGALRFMPQLRDLVRRRFPRSKVPRGEFVPGHHSKLRYFRPIREEMYSKMLGWIREFAPQVFVYLCMEDRAAWQCGMGWAPRDTAELSDRMDSIVR